MTIEIPEKQLTQVRALLAKAESSEFAEEAAAFSAKAQELMARYAIDRAMVDSQTRSGKVAMQRIVIPKPYSKHKVGLLSAAALANRCRVIIGMPDDLFDVDFVVATDQSDTICTVFGYESDLECVEMLFTSLLVQATNTMLGYGSITDGWGNTTRSFRAAFLVGFARTVRARLEEARKTVTDAADESSGGALLPVLADRDREVEAAVDQSCPDLQPMRISISNGGGLAAGAEAGMSADVGLGGIRSPKGAKSLE